MRLVLIEPAGGTAIQVLSERLSAAGLPAAERVECGFERGELSAAIANALATAEMVVVAGGLTPPDGAARAAAADALGVPLCCSQRALAHLQRHGAVRGQNDQVLADCAMLPAGAKAVVGDALLPGCACVTNGRVLLLTGEQPDERLLSLLISLLTAICTTPPPDKEPPCAPPLLTPAGHKTKRTRRSAKRLPQPIRRVLARWRSIDAGFRRMLLLCTALIVLAAAAIGWVVSLPPQKPADLIVLSGALDEPGALSPDQPFELSPSGGTAIESPSLSAPPVSSAPPPVSSAPPPVSSAPPPVSSTPPPVSSAPPPVSSAPPPVSSTPPPVSSAPAPVSSTPPPVSSAPPPVSSEPELPPEVQLPMTKPEPPDKNPGAHPDAFDELLYYSAGGKSISKNAYDLICGIVQNETSGNFAPEALKAHAVATYTFLKYNNARQTAPAAALGSPVSEQVKQAVSAVLGQTITYNGAIINAVYHSTSGGSTTSARSVWGGDLPYLVPVESPWDKQAPKYAQSYSVQADSFASGVKRTYGITLEGDPSDWIVATRDAPGGYVGTVTLGGHSTAQGGSYGSGKAITGRSIREQLFAYQIRSHCFDVSYDAGANSFRFTTYGYGHGVGMSQYGAHYMALEGYDYLQILAHYYTGTTVG